MNIIPQNWTGERLETFVYSDVTIEHLHRYAMAMQYVNSKTVLDIACGEGYGSNLLAQNAKQVIGVDISKETIEQAKNKYVRDNIEFICGSTSGIPVSDDYFDIVVSFETIEHHDEHEKMLQEIKRVLRNGGILIISSPDKKFYTDKRQYKNPFHIKELYFEEFKKLLSKYFNTTQFFLQNNVVASVITPLNGEAYYTKFYSGTYENIQKNEFQPLYNICIASDNNLPAKEISLFNGLSIYEMESQLKAREVLNRKIEELKNVYNNSWSYRIGRSVTYPLRMFKKILRLN